MLCQVAVDTRSGVWQADLFASPEHPEESAEDYRDVRLEQWLSFAIQFQAQRRGGVFLATLPPLS